MSEPQAKLKQHSLGGQAVLEGVMMRSQGWWALAVRRPDGTVHRESHPVGGFEKKRPLLGKALIRGVMGLGEAMAIGVRALAISARHASGEDEGEALSSREIAMAIGVALLFFVGLFVVLPAIAVRGAGHKTAGQQVLHNLFEGFVRIGIFLAYILLISRMKDIKRVFEYHGAEHKVIAAHEAGAPMTKEGAKPFSTVHVRCGTDFLFLVMLLSVLIFSVVPRSTVLIRIASRIVLLPVVAGVSYEALRIAARFERNAFVRLLTWPGRGLQRITTREPDDSQLEVALVALGELLEREGLAAPQPPAPPEPPPLDAS